MKILLYSINTFKILTLISIDITSSTCLFLNIKFYELRIILLSLTLQEQSGYLLGYHENTTLNGFQEVRKLFQDVL